MKWVNEFFDRYEIFAAAVLFITCMLYLLYHQYRTIDPEKELDKLKVRLDKMGIGLDKKATGLCALFFSNYLSINLKATLFLYSALCTLAVMLALLFKSMNGIELNDAQLFTNLIIRAVPSTIALFTVGLLLKFNRHYQRVADFYLSRYHAILLSNALDGGQNIDQWIDRSYHRMDMGNSRTPTELFTKVVSASKPGS